MAKTKKRRKGKSFTVSLAVIGGLVPAFMNAKAYYDNEGWSGVPEALAQSFTGYSPREKKFKLTFLNRGLIPLGAALLLRKVMGKLGVNRALANSGIPLLRV